MIILIDTSTNECKLAIVNGDIRQDYSWQADRRLAKELLGYLRDKLAESNGAFSDLTGIGIMQGPGSFTGLRIGMAVMNTLAESLSIPIVGTTGTDWQQIALQRLSDGENDRIVLPDYGAEAHITKPRK